MSTYVLERRRMLLTAYRPFRKLISLKKITGILKTRRRNSTIVWLHQMDFNEELELKTRWKLFSNSVGYFERILEAAPFKAAAVRSPASHLTNHPSKTNKISCSLLEK